MNLGVQAATYPLIKANTGMIVDVHRPINSSAAMTMGNLAELLNELSADRLIAILAFDEQIV